jgi:hypothetical protein
MGFGKIRADVSRVSTFCNSVGLHIQLDIKNLAVEYIINFLSLLSSG